MIKHAILHMISIYVDSFGDRITAVYHNHYLTVNQKVTSQCTSDINWLLLLYASTSVSIFLVCYCILFYPSKLFGWWYNDLLENRKKKWKFSFRVDRLDRVEPDPQDQKTGWVGLVLGGGKQGRVGLAPRVPRAGQGRVGLVGFIWQHYFECSLPPCFAWELIILWLKGM